MDIFRCSIVRKSSKINVLAGFMTVFLLMGTITPSYSFPANALDVAGDLNNASNFSISHQKSPSFVPNQIIIGFKQGLNQESIDDFYADYSSKYGLSEKKNLNSENSKIPITKLVRTSIPVNYNLIEKLQNDKRVDFAEPDYLVSINTNDSYYNLLWGLENTGQDIRGSTGTSDADIDAPLAWAKLGTTNKVIVGIIDTGVDYDHEDLAAHMWTNDAEATGIAGIDDDQNGYVDDIHGWNAYRNNGNPDDDNGHGSHTAGTIGAVGNNQKGIIGVSQDVEIVACKFLSRSGSGSTSDAIECFNYFTKLKDQGYDVRVTNNSWGGGGYSSALYNAMNNSKILHVVAAGNDGVNIDSSPQYPASYNLQNIISVAATDFNDNYASFSNFGNSVDIAAPGVNIASTYKNNGYVWMSGTSMAAPHVTGAAALALSADNSQSTNSVKTLIMENADTLNSQSKYSYKNHRLNLNLILSQLQPVVGNPTAPSSPTLSSTGKTDATININWTTPSNGGSAITGYTYQWTTDSTFTSYNSTTVSPTNSATISGLEATTQYFIRVIATNGVGDSIPSNVLDVTTSQTPVFNIVIIESVDPTSLYKGQSVPITITGSGFNPGATVTFENGAGPTPQVTVINVSDDGTEITGMVTTSNKGPGKQNSWDIRVTNLDGSTDVLSSSVTVSSNKN